MPLIAHRVTLPPSGQSCGPQPRSRIVPVQASLPVKVSIPFPCHRLATRPIFQLLLVPENQVQRGNRSVGLRKASPNQLNLF